MKGWLLAMALVLSAGAFAQKGAPAATFELTGIVADAKGPLGGKVVRVGPLDDKGNMLRMRNLSTGQSLNPQATSDAQGRFAIRVDRSMFRGLREDRLGLTVYTDLGGGRLATSHETASVPIDPKKEKMDAGRVTLGALKAR